jgi:hypothetical protein
MSSRLTVEIRHQQAGDVPVRDDFRIEALRYDMYTQTPTFLLSDGHGTFTAEVNAEAFYRAVCAAWELVKPLGTDAAAR